MVTFVAYLCRGVKLLEHKISDGEWRRALECQPIRSYLIDLMTLSSAGTIRSAPETASMLPTQAMRITDQLISVDGLQ